MPDNYDNCLNRFRQNVKSVNKLVDFDSFVLEHAITIMQKCKDILKEKHGMDNKYILAQDAIDSIKGIRDHQSLKQNYKTIYNQCIVLLVSYFGSALEDIFVSFIDTADIEKSEYQIPNEEFKLKTYEILEIKSDKEFSIGKLIVGQKDISFQDMGSISRALIKYIGYEPPKDEIVSDIIFAQASRHIIVHKGGLIDRKFLHQVSHAENRRLKTKIEENMEIAFEPEAIQLLGNSMIKYMEKVVDIIHGK